MSETTYHEWCVNTPQLKLGFNENTDYDTFVYKQFSLNGTLSKEDTIDCIQDTIYSNKESIKDKIKLTEEYCNNGYCWFSDMWNTIKYYKDFIENIDIVIKNYKTKNE